MKNNTIIIAGLLGLLAFKFTRDKAKPHAAIATASNATAATTTPPDMPGEPLAWLGGWTQ